MDIWLVSPTGVALPAVLAFLAMEPLTYLAHRYVMHGAAARIHRSHHRRWPARRQGDPFLEANDAFPVVFAALTVLGFVAGLNVAGLAVLVPVGVGVTLYGLAYAFVHDVYVHGRLPWRRRSRLLDHLAAAHALHHRFGGEPYGMLLPVVPAALWERARALEAERIATVDRSRVTTPEVARAGSPERAAAVPRP